MGTIGDIIREYLKTNGFDGLVSYDFECGCEIFGCGCEIDDLFACESEGISECEPGYKIPCDCGGDCGWHIGTKSPLT